MQPRTLGLRKVEVISARSQAYKNLVDISVDILDTERLAQVLAVLVCLKPLLQGQSELEGDHSAVIQVRIAIKEFRAKHPDIKPSAFVLGSGQPPVAGRGPPRHRDVAEALCL